MAESQGIPWERWLSIGGSIVAPVTALTTLLFYFGYVSVREEYLYFGLDVDTIGLSTQDFVMRSGQPLLVPLLVLPLLAAAAVLAARRLRSRVLAHPRAAETTGGAILAVGVLLIGAYPVLGEWTYYPLVTPLGMALGGAVAAYTVAVRQAPTAARVALWLVVAAGIFWATATVAQWSGAGLAREQADTMGELPQVVVDTTERLYLHSPDLTETALPEAEGQDYAFRYRGWRLLIQKGDRMFLAPCRPTADRCVWRPGSPTVLLEEGRDGRLQFFAP